MSKNKPLGIFSDTTYPLNVILTYIAELELLGLDVTHTRSGITSSGEAFDLDLEIKNGGMSPDQQCAKVYTKLHIGTPNTGDVRTERVGVIALVICNVHGTNNIDLVPIAFPNTKNPETTIPELAKIVAREFEVYKFNGQMSHLRRI